MEGWVKIHRKLSENLLWTSEPFSRGQAWIDLILLANHKYNYFYKRGVKIELKRGQLGWSVVALSERWQWSRSKVNKFLNDLEKEQQIKQQKSNVTQIITIIKYEEYQEKEQQSEQQKGSRKAAEEQQKDTNKNDKNEEKVKKLEERQLEFKKEVESYANKYDIAMLTAFYAYWSEPNKTKTKLKYEMQGTWETNRRLITWKSRQK
jgi:DNA-binding MarR family transcriptional regulator